MAFKPSYNPESGQIKAMVRLSFCKVFEKTKSAAEGKEKYRTNGLIYKNTEEGKANIAVINAAIKDCISKTKPWNGKEPAKLKEQMGDGPKGRWLLFDGDAYYDQGGDVRAGYEGTKYLRLTNDRKVKVKDRRGNDVDEDDKEDLFQSGHWAVAIFHIYSVSDKDKGGNGIFATLDALQFYKRDEPFAGGGVSDDDFDDLGDEDDDLAPTKKSVVDADDI